MLCPIIDPSFSPYGRIEPPHAEHPKGFGPIPLREGETLSLYRFDRETSWDYCSGMTVLLIRDPEREEETSRLFYLDRHITIRPGVTFGFFPLGRESSVSGDEALLAAASPEASVPVPKEGARFLPPEIFTVFRQTGRGGLYFRGEKHPPLELVYLEKGLLHNYCGGRDLILHPKELLLFGPDRWHMQYADEDVQFLTVSFTWEGHDFSGCCGRVISASAELQEEAQNILREHEKKAFGWEEFIRARFQLLLLSLLRQTALSREGKKPSPASEAAHREIVDQAVRFLSAHIRQKLTVPRLAAAVNVSPSQLTALFQTHLGTSPAKYITRVRLEESKALLASGQMSVGEVASFLGYASIQHFSRQFHEWTGASPTAYARAAFPERAEVPKEGGDARREDLRK